MPNLVHSLDASNIHLMCQNLSGIPIYTIHDCFASTANNMSIIEYKVKTSFIEIYFKDGNYLEKMHNHLIEQIKSYNNTIIKDGNEYIEINNVDYLLPKIPEAFINNDVLNIFIDGIRRSKFFIS